MSKQPQHTSQLQQQATTAHVTTVTAASSHINRHNCNSSQQCARMHLQQALQREVHGVCDTCDKGQACNLLDDACGAMLRVTRHMNILMQHRASRDHKAQTNDTRNTLKVTRHTSHVTRHTSRKARGQTLRIKLLLRSPNSQAQNVTFLPQTIKPNHMQTQLRTETRKQAHKNTHKHAHTRAHACTNRQTRT